jgi:hypothetical protein
MHTKARKLLIWQTVLVVAIVAMLLLVIYL